MLDNKEEKKSTGRSLIGWLLYLLVIIGLAYLIVTFVGQRTKVSGPSMQNTLHNGDNLIVDKLSYRSMIRRGMILLYFRSSLKKIHFISNVSSDCRARQCR